jgi:DnaJ family protein C protein 8
MAEDTFDSFMKEVKQIEEKDSVYTSEKQMSRLLRPGSSYANLNPFEVLMIDPESTSEQIRKQYKKLSILLHPDKNQDQREKSQQAFDIITKAYKALEDEGMRKRALEVVEEAQYKVDQNLEEKRKKLKKDGLKDVKIEEDLFPEKKKEAVRVMTMKLFADYERKRRTLDERAAEERKRKREEEIAEEEKKKLQQEWNKNYEESRESRVSNWQSFQKGSKSKGPKKLKGLIRPPRTPL